MGLGRVEADGFGLRTLGVPKAFGGAGADIVTMCIAGEELAAGDHYILNGSKRYISNGCMAKLYFVVARTDPSKPLSEGDSVFVVPSDTLGYRAGFFHEK